MFLQFSKIKLQRINSMNEGFILFMKKLLHEEQNLINSIA